MVGSKWGYTYTADWHVTLDDSAKHDGAKHESKEHSLPVLNRQIEEIRASFGGQLDLYQIHSATLESGVLKNSRASSRNRLPQQSETTLSDRALIL